MSMAAIPDGVIFLITFIIMTIAIEAGLRLGRTIVQRSQDEKEEPVAAIAAAILSLAGFMLAFTFGIASDRYDDRKALVREEANAITTAWLRSDFLPEPDRGEAVGLLREYVVSRLDAVQEGSLDRVQTMLAESKRIQRKLWDMAVRNARKDMNSDVAALYIESLNELMDIHTLRVAIALQAQIPGMIWLFLYTLVILGMIAVGYHTAIAGSARRSWAIPTLVLSFTLVIALIASLDSPRSDFIIAPQEPLIDLRASMAAGFEARSDLRDKR